MTATADIEIPIRPDHVERRHGLVEMFRPIMLDRVAAFRFAATQFEAMMYTGPDDDEAIDALSDQVREAQTNMAHAIITYRNIRVIQGAG